MIKFHLQKALLAIILIGTSFLTGCRDEPSQHSDHVQLPPQEVKVAASELVLVRNQLELMGTIVPLQRAEIAAKISGTIIEMPVVLGSVVTKGDVLAVVSAGEIDAKLRQSAAQLEQAKRNLDREKKLLSRNAATPESVRSHQETVDIAEAAYQEAQTYQGYTRIKAPINGKVTSKPANVGDLATPGKVLMKIEDNSILEVHTDIPENYIFDIEVGDTLAVAIPSSGISIPGIVAEKALTADPTTRTAPLKLTLESNPRLFGGQFARVSLDTGRTKTIVVPETAVMPIGQMERVFVVEDSTARLRLVRTGARYGDKVEILSGLEPDQQVVITNNRMLSDGQQISINQ